MELFCIWHFDSNLKILLWQQGTTCSKPTDTVQTCDCYFCTLYLQYFHESVTTTVGFYNDINNNNLTMIMSVYCQDAARVIFSVFEQFYHDSSSFRLISLADKCADLEFVRNVASDIEKKQGRQLHTRVFTETTAPPSGLSTPLHMQNSCSVNLPTIQCNSKKSVLTKLFIRYWFQWKWCLLLCLKFSNTCFLVQFTFIWWPVVGWIFVWCSCSRHCCLFC